MNFRTLDLNLLRIFDMVMVERNVTRAATRLSMTQPAVSNALRRLRESIGDDLFKPGPAGVAPSAHAVALWPAVRQALGGLREALDPQAFDPASDERKFTLAMADATAAVLVPAFVAGLLDERLRVELSVQPLTTRDPRPQLEHGSADAALGFFPDVDRALAAAGGDAATVLSPLYACEYVCAMRRDHPLAGADALTLDAYCAADHVRVNFAGRRHGFVDEALVRLGRARRAVVTLNHFSTAAQLVARSDLLAVFPRSYLPCSGVADGVCLRRLPFDMPRIEIGLLWHRRHERDPGHRWLRERIASLAATLFETPV